ncbi:N(G),N(G)-dimethylarginine dimethylaminohydrolase 1 isoform X1 [Musca autumnalis]|uniref:N(G),N(G)-dimethylarginine dimethylaminohydrolase 1 isoform X1 n=1 Tax=Musca autumnalis TaxID=221902 RepID=UPI003CE8DD63
MSLKYSHAIVARISDALRNKEDFDLETAKEQHKQFCSLLRELGLDVIELPPDDELPYSVFVETSVVICNGVALIAKSEDPTRQKEANSMAITLKKELDIPVEVIDNPNAQLHGGDVLFTGREFFVGISNFTNEDGARAVATTFPEYPVTPIKVGLNDSTRPIIFNDFLDLLHFQVGGPKPLKYYVTMAGPDVLSVSNSIICQEIVKRMEREASFKYAKITLPEEHATNMLYINGTLVHRSPEEILDSYKVIKEKIDIPSRNINISEFSKFSTGLTSACILLRRWKSIRSI